ncbi:hypothetical protein HY524_00680 [Candidatus Berkelbacteria bacterium]|nr:hypothetical protein [Candidatus Berkelbacteria bacterium]
MSARTTFLRSIEGKDDTWLRSEIASRDSAIRTLKFELGFGKLDTLTHLRSAKRERAQLLERLSSSQRLTQTKQ